jgi:hypothetical protein
MTSPARIGLCPTETQSMSDAVRYVQRTTSSQNRHEHHDSLRQKRIRSVALLRDPAFPDIGPTRPSLAESHVAIIVPVYVSLTRLSSLSSMWFGVMVRY